MATREEYERRLLVTVTKLIRAVVGAEHASTVTDAVGFEYECTTRFRVPLAPQRPTEPDGSVNPDLYIAPWEE
jgi:hypothetical protein